MSLDKTFFDFAKVEQQQIKLKINQYINPNKQADSVSRFHFVPLIFMLFLLLVCYSYRIFLLTLQW